MHGASWRQSYTVFTPGLRSYRDWTSAVALGDGKDGAVALVFDGEVGPRTLSWVKKVMAFDSVVGRC